MVRWFSNAKSVKLPEEKVQVNYIYNFPDRLDEVQKIITDSLLDFGTWNGKPLYVWLCSNEESWKDAHSKISSLGEEAQKLETRSEMRTVYCTPEILRLLGETEKRSLKPNLLIHLSRFSKVDNQIKKPMAEHEFSHIDEIDLGYYLPIFKAQMNFALSHMYHSKSEYYRLFSIVLGRTCDEISANEVFIDHGLTKDFLVYAKHISNDLKEDTSPGKIESFIPADWFLKTLHSTSYILPFKHKNKKTYAGKMRSTVNEYLKRVKVLDAVSLRDETENIMDRIRNPIQVSDVERVYDEATRKFETVL